MAFGLLLLVIGLLTWGGALSWLGRLPGDRRFSGQNVRMYVPITSMLLVSLILSAVVSVLLWPCAVEARPRRAKMLPYSPTSSPSPVVATNLRSQSRGEVFTRR